MKDNMQIRLSQIRRALGTFLKVACLMYRSMSSMHIGMLRSAMPRGASRLVALLALTKRSERACSRAYVHVAENAYAPTAQEDTACATAQAAELARVRP
uniref:Secreted protein n=1 Tax=Hydatigena taeniaeformis TaxID=6205 RepID=A0A0R3X6B2_HYDTA